MTQLYPSLDPSAPPLSDDEEEGCPICFDSTDLVALDCHPLHRVCGRCIESIDKCPLCRAPRGNRLQSDSLTSALVQSTMITVLMLAVCGSFFFAETFKDASMSTYAIRCTNDSAARVAVQEKEPVVYHACGIEHVCRNGVCEEKLRRDPRSNIVCDGRSCRVELVPADIQVSTGSCSTAVCNRGSCWVKPNPGAECITDSDCPALTGSFHTYVCNTTACKCVLAPGHK